MSDAARVVLLVGKVFRTCLLVCDPFKDINGDLDDLLRILLCQVLNAGPTCIGMLHSGRRLPPLACQRHSPLKVKSSTCQASTRLLGSFSSLVDPLPSLQAMIMGPMVPLSSSSAKYISFFSFILFAMYSVFTGFPAGPVCFVTSVCNAWQDFQALNPSSAPPAG